MADIDDDGDGIPDVDERYSQAAKQDITSTIDAEQCTGVLIAL